MSRIAIFGGTFNPPHRGHVEAACACAEQLALDRLLLVPAGLPPHKNLPHDTPSAVHRLRMAQLCAREIPHAEVCDIELRREGKSYTVDTVRELARYFADDTLWLVVGDDMLETFSHWRSPEEIVRWCRLAAVQRKPEKADAIRQAAKQLERELGAQVDIVKNLVVPFSSTQYRDSGRSELLLPSVAAYIEDNALYRPRPDLDSVRERVGKILSERRMKHTLGVEQEAAQLAEIWGEDVYDARLAGLLHDCTRELSVQKQLNLVEKYGIINQYDCEQYPQLLHALTGAAEARHTFGASAAVARAIASHTVGAVNMSLLGKIIFIADATEAGRDYDGVDHLRRMARCDINAAVVASMEQTDLYLRKQGKTPHPAAAAALLAMKREILK